MTIDTTCNCSTVCTCDHYMPPFEVWKKHGYNQTLAQDCFERGKSVLRIYEWMLSQVFEYHSGDLFDHHRERIDLMSWNAAGNDYIDQHLGVDPCSRLKRYLKRVRVNRVHRLYKDHYGLVTLATHAKAIHNCRTVGPCSLRARQVAAAS